VSAEFDLDQRLALFDDRAVIDKELDDLAFLSALIWLKSFMASM